MNTLGPFGLFVASYESAGECEKVFKKREVGFGEIVVKLTGIPFGKRSVFVHPALYIFAAALDEGAGETLAFGLSGGGYIQLLKRRIQQA